ncbi:unnamed protein product [Effrenium voratum]|uniref:Cyclic nucleotide-binding domain-containing protein n=1 Tax=Effrenium voratum TaxID=2562239 RepID=A0AA36MKE8_9DINO|nr:unnamed protein product [Effrenium voratum]CAJ1432002.1 unnamed protein product [Effrenium voratum]
MDDAGAASADLDFKGFEELSAHGFCQSLRKEVVGAMARVAKCWLFTVPQRVILHETLAKSENSGLWLVTRGSVEVLESSQVLCTLEGGQGIFGDSVVFGKSERQPFTLRTAQVPVIAWCLQLADLHQILKYYSHAKPFMEEFISQQERKILWSRVSQLLLFSHCQSFTQHLLAKVEVKHYRADSILWSPVMYQKSVRAVVAGTVLISKTSEGDYDHALLNPQDRRKTVHIHCHSSEKLDKELTPRRVSESGLGDLDLERVKSFSWRMGEAMKRPGLGSSDSELGSVSESSEEEDSSSGSSDSEPDSALSGSSSDSEKKVEERPLAYELPETFPRMEPESHVQAKAGPHCLVFNEAALLGYQMTDKERFRSCLSLTDCIVCSWSAADFREAVQAAPRERKRFDLLKAARFKEWERCGVHQLASIEVIAKCSKEFLVDLASAATPEICFQGSDIIAEPSDDLVLLMNGNADKLGSNGKRHRAQAPEILSTSNWLGDPEAGESVGRVKAKGVCQVLRFERQVLMDLLSRHPHETAVIVAEASRLRTRRMSAAKIKVRLRGGLQNPNGLFWYCPFCDNLGDKFLEELIKSMDCFKLIPGQPLLRNRSSHMDLVVVLTKGRVSFGSEAREAPQVICGFDRSGYEETQAQVLSEVYCMNFERLKQLVQRQPEETRAFLMRLVAFQQRLERKQGLCWWSPANVLRRHEPFASCPDSFLHGCAQLMSSRFCLPGEVIVEEADKVEHAMIIETGVARVHQQTRATLRGCPDRTGEVQDSYLVGSISGAYTFAGMTRRLATIKAVTLCKIVEIPISGMMTLLDQNWEAKEKFREIAERRFKEMAPEPLEEHPFFKSFTKSFLNTLRTKCNAQVFFTGETILKQGDCAESMVIISSASVVTIFVDGRKLKELSGGCTLGVPAILSAKPGKRFATIVAQGACSVQTLTRKDWRDALKSHEEHRHWIQDFTHEQLEVANKQAVETDRRYKWRKIQERESQAIKVHCKRRHVGVAPPQKPAPHIEDELERWECFNGKEAVMPHLRLPQLTSLSLQAVREEEDEAQEVVRLPSSRRHSDVGKIAKRLDRVERRSVLGDLPADLPGFSNDVWLDCQDAFGLLHVAHSEGGLQVPGI